MNIKKHEDYLKSLKTKNISVVPLENYITNTTRILHKCICGREWMTTPSSVKKGFLCGCSRKGINKKTHKDYLQILNEKGIKHLPLEEYKGQLIKIKHKCEKGHITERSPSNVMKEYGCLECKKTAELRSLENYLDDLKQKNILLMPIEPYINANTKINHKCPCGNIVKRSPNTVLQKEVWKTCRSCSKLLTNKEYLERIQAKKIKIKPLEEYKGMHKHISHLCICGFPRKLTPHNVLRYQSCGCIKSKNEVFIEQFFVDNKIKYKREKTFSDLKGKRNKNYKFDFYLTEKNILIEFHGEQHYRFVERFHKTEEQFSQAKKRDEIKEEFARNRNIPLIKISYLEKDPLDFLGKQLKILK